MKTSSSSHGNTGNNNAMQEFEAKTQQLKFRCTASQKFKIEQNADKAGFKSVAEYALFKLL
jgi:hypothetical protein